jgi:pre-rRNA-processing protein RIX1
MGGPSADEKGVQRLRAIAYRLSSAEIGQLPQLVAQIHPQLIECRDLLSNPQNASSDATAAVHQFKTKISSLLQDRSIQGRWAAVVLVKCTIELGGWQALHQCAPWVRSLVGILKKSDPSTTKRLCIITLTRIFHLTHAHSNLVREITTPNLPPYITACLNHFQPEDLQRALLEHPVLLEAMLRSFSNLLPWHPTVFRPFISQIVRIVSFLTKVPGDGVAAVSVIPFPHNVRDAAQRVYVLLHSSATKSGTMEDRDSGFAKAISMAVNTANQFRHQDNPHIKQLNGDATPIVSLTDMCDLLELIRHYVLTPSQKATASCTGQLIALFDRLRAITTSDLPAGPKLQISRREWLRLLFDLPQIQVATIELVVAVQKRFGTAARPLADDLFYCITKIFCFNPSNVTVRLPVYQILGPLLSMIGSTGRAELSLELQTIIKECCSDLLRLQRSNEESQGAPTDKNTKGRGKSAINPNAIIGATERTMAIDMEYPGLRTAAYQLLPLLLRELPAEILTPTIRAEIERTAVLTGHQEALLESIMNPVKSGPSLLPFAARLDATNPVVESILRPRMPVIRTGHQDFEDADIDEEDEAVEPYVPPTTTPFSHPFITAVDDTPAAPKLEHQTLANTEAFSIPLPDSTKRPLIDEAVEDTSSKRVRFVSKPEQSRPINTGPQEGKCIVYKSTVSEQNESDPGASKVATASAMSAVDIKMQNWVEDDSEDDSDFEVPPLVLGMGDVDDEEE